MCQTAMRCVRAIGQGTNSYTPVQLSRYVSTISNGGTCYDLTLVDKVADSSQNNKIKNNKAKVRNELDIKSSTLNAIRRGMYMVVNNGSLKSVFQKVPVKVAGKTGTAQISANEPNHALFVSYAPYDSPKISVTVVMQMRLLQVMRHLWRAMYTSTILMKRQEKNC